MKMIVAIIRPERLEAVEEALKKVLDEGDHYRITVCVNDAYEEKTVDAILAGARSEGGGAVGDGKIFVLPLEQVIRIRTGERGGSAI